MRRQASGLLPPGRGASFRSGPQGTVEREAFRRRSHAFATPRPRGLSPADACRPACGNCPDQSRAQWAGPSARTHARVAGSGLEEKARPALVNRQEAWLKTQDLSIHFGHETGKPGRCGCRLDFPNCGALAGGAPLALRPGSRAPRDTTEETSSVMNRGVSGESTNAVSH